jgi:hypothetical protein
MKTKTREREKLEINNMHLHFSFNGHYHHRSEFNKDFFYCTSFRMDDVKINSLSMLKSPLRLLTPVSKTPGASRSR